MAQKVKVESTTKWIFTYEYINEGKKRSLTVESEHDGRYKLCDNGYAICHVQSMDDLERFAMALIDIAQEAQSKGLE